ncbi:MAG: helix-turn-helix domain-containing protein [Actinobacteria bacterium]|nr:helix-turn-helix domain-containing protein [Actinomycetota bacterium]
MSRSTLDRWIRLYRAKGLEGLKPTPRSDTGALRRHPELFEEAAAMRREVPSRSGGHRRAPEPQPRHPRLGPHHPCPARLPGPHPPGTDGRASRVRPVRSRAGEPALDWRLPGRPLGAPPQGCPLPAGQAGALRG